MALYAPFFHGIMPPLLSASYLWLDPQSQSLPPLLVPSYLILWLLVIWTLNTYGVSFPPTPSCPLRSQLTYFLLWSTAMPKLLIAPMYTSNLSQLSPTTYYVRHPHPLPITIVLWFVRAYYFIFQCDKPKSITGAFRIICSMDPHFPIQILCIFLRIRDVVWFKKFRICCICVTKLVRFDRVCVHQSHFHCQIIFQSSRDVCVYIVCPLGK